MYSDQVVMYHLISLKIFLNILKAVGLFGINIGTNDGLYEDRCYYTSYMTTLRHLIHVKPFPDDHFYVMFF